MLSPKITICPNDDCKSFDILDSTGLYYAVYNTGGWGNTNISPSDVTLATVTVYQPGENYNDPTAGIVIDVTTQLNSTVLPSDILNYTIDLTQFSNQNLNNNCNLIDGIWTIVYNITDSDGNTYEYTIKHVQICSTQCCVDRMLEKAIDARLCGKKCDDNSIHQALVARAMLIQAIKYATGCLNENVIEKLINSAKKICNPGSSSSSSKGCGCGCS